jgi:hypothetical protein
VQPWKQAQQHAASPEMGTSCTKFESQEANHSFGSLVPEKKRKKSLSLFISSRKKRNKSPNFLISSRKRETNH